MSSADKPRDFPGDWKYAEDAEFCAGEWSWFMTATHKECGRELFSSFEVGHRDGPYFSLRLAMDRHECP